MKFTKREKELLGDASLVMDKHRVTRKVQNLCQGLRQTIQKETKDWAFLAPEGFVQTRSKLSRGENLGGFPYVYLDCPQYFSPTDFLTFRVIFWWGKYIVSSLLLQGQYLPIYKKNLITVKDQLHSFYLSTSRSPWDWDRRKTKGILLAGKDKLSLEDLRKFRFLKISWYLSYRAFFQPRFDFIDYQVQKYRKLKPIIVQSPMKG